MGLMMAGTWIAAGVLTIGLGGCNKLQTGGGASGASGDQRSGLVYSYLRSAGGDSPILIAGGSLSVFSKGAWSAWSAGSPGAPATTIIGDGTAYSYNYIFLDGVVPGDSSYPSRWLGVNVPWAIYLHGRYPDGAVLRPAGAGSPPAYGLKLCQKTTTTGNIDCDLAQNPLPPVLDATHPSLITASTNARFYNPANYNNLLLGAGLSLRRYQYYPGDQNCLETNGGLCEHIGQVDISFETAVGVVSTYTYRCLLGTCSIEVGAYSNVSALSAVRKQQ